MKFIHDICVIRTLLLLKLAIRLYIYTSDILIDSRCTNNYFGINQNAISICIYTRLELIVEVVYIVDYLVYTVSTILYTLYLCVHSCSSTSYSTYCRFAHINFLARATRRKAAFISHSHNSIKKVSTMTSKSPLSPYFWAVLRTATGILLFLFIFLVLLLV